jgi:hypothetical protein
MRGRGLIESLWPLPDTALSTGRSRIGFQLSAPRSRALTKGGKMNQDKSTFRMGYVLSVINIVFGALYLGSAIVSAIPRAS